LRGWSDYDLEQEGQLTHPLRYDQETDKYVACELDEAFEAIAKELKALDPKSVVFYSSGRASLETSYLYALFPRLFGCNNLPDSSNMCHETTAVALKKTIGVGVGTVVYDDLAKCDAIFFFGQNPGSNSPRFLHPLQDAARRGVEIITFNPVREKGLETFINPHPRARADGGSLDPVAPDGSGRDRAQPQSSRQRQDRLSYAMPRPDRARPTDQRPAGGDDGRTFSSIHGSIGRRKPASEELMSEVAIVAGLAKATLSPNPKTKWDLWIADYTRIRDEIAETYSEEFHDFNARMWEPGGFYRGNKARERIWQTKSGGAEFTTPEMLAAIDFADAPGRYRLITLRSNDQFNTTIYGNSDRLRGIEGTRQVLLMNPREIERAGLCAGQMVSLVGDAEDGVHREAGPLKVTPFKLPDGCIGAYYPEMNSLVPLSHHDKESKTPAYKSVPVRIRAEAA
jgi:anaerobic selenocysteine-containing dehydrogenase